MQWFSLFDKNVNQPSLGTVVYFVAEHHSRGRGRGVIPQQISIWSLAVNQQHRYKLFDTGWRMCCEICTSRCFWYQVWENKSWENKEKKRSLTRICSYIHCLHYALYVSPSGDTFDWQQTVEAMIHCRRTSGKTWCSQLHTAAPVKDSDLERRLTLLLWYFDMEIKPASLCFLLSLSLTCIKLKLHV